MQKKIIVMTISAMGAALSTGVNAQGNVYPEEKVVIGVDNQQRLTTPVQSSNPMGSITTTAPTLEINYGGAATLNQRDIVVSPEIRDGAYGQVPAGLPAGLPNAQGAATTAPTQLIRQDRDELSALERTINILNTPDGTIERMNKDLYDKSKLLNTSPVPLAKPVNSVVVASLAPGATSPVIRVARGKTSAIMVTDSTGKPWPIVNFDGLPEEDFVVNRLDAPAPDGYVLSVTPLGQFVSGNLVLILKDLPSPLVLEFVSGQSSVDVKTEIRVQAIGPNATFHSIGVPDAIDTNLLSVLQGVSTSGMKALETNTNAVQAWTDGTYMYLRTRYKVQSPAPLNMTSSADGTYAYKMVKTPAVLYRAGLGKEGSFSVSGF